MVLPLRSVILLSRIALIIYGVIVAVLFLAECYVAEDDAERERERLMRDGT